MTPRIPGVDYSAASKAPEPSTLHSQRDSVPTVEPAQANAQGGSGLNLYAYTRCPKCKRIIHRTESCPDCGDEYFGNGGTQ